LSVRRTSHGSHPENSVAGVAELADAPDKGAT
jgi:hypothetical protein